MVRPEMWACPVCGGQRCAPRWPVPSDASEGGVDARSFRPSSGSYGRTAATVVSCTTCGHGSLGTFPSPGAMSDAYADAADPVSLREEEGQIETARRALRQIESLVEPGAVCDIGCWTGSFLVAAEQRGWKALGVEPSAWAAARATERGLDVQCTDLADADLPAGACRLVVLCDVLEHLSDPGAALASAAAALGDPGLVYLTVPDAGSVVARAMGRRWWSVLPMHVQYFTRASMTRLLESHGFEVVSMSSHAKAFTASYYAERLGGYQPAVQTATLAGLRRLGLADRQIAPDLHDRMAIIALAS